MKKKQVLLLSLISLFILSLFSFAVMGAYLDVPGADGGESAIINNRQNAAASANMNFSGLDTSAHHARINLTAYVIQVANEPANITVMNFSFSNSTDKWMLNVTARNGSMNSCNNNCSYFFNFSQAVNNYRFNGSMQFFPNEGQYNITVNGSNLSNDNYQAHFVNESIFNLRIDRTPPNLTVSPGNFNNSGRNISGTAANGTGYTASDLISFNITVTDFNVSLTDRYAVFFNFSNVTGSTGDEGGNLTSGSYFTREADYNLSETVNTSDVRASHHRYFFNLSVNASLFGEGHHNITFIMNDSVNNRNDTSLDNAAENGAYMMNFTIDRTAPTVEISNFTAFKIGNNTPAMTFNYSDNLMVSADCRLILNESLAGAVVVAQNNATTNATNTTLQVNHTLGDGEYEMTVNCTDFAGNEANSTTKVNITVDTAAPGVSVTKSSSDSSSLTLAVA
ncbi:MAG: Ig-like domain-containing protein, partial [Anaerolineales bacterium]|nr:Ig-like domain-containing protein [Anaerolineales bacterium]